MSGLIFLESLSILYNELRTLTILRFSIFTCLLVILKKGLALLSTARVTSYFSVFILLQIIDTFLSAPPQVRVGTNINNFILVLACVKKKVVFNKQG